MQEELEQKSVAISIKAGKDVYKRQGQCCSQRPQAMQADAGPRLPASWA